jgi:hypothetical protein
MRDGLRRVVPARGHPHPRPHQRLGTMVVGQASTNDLASWLLADGGPPRAGLRGADAHAHEYDADAREEWDRKNRP